MNAATQAAAVALAIASGELAPDGAPAAGSEDATALRASIFAPRSSRRVTI